MRIKTTLKKLKRGDVVSIDWIDAGDLDDSPSSWFSEDDDQTPLFIPDLGFSFYKS